MFLRTLFAAAVTVGLLASSAASAQTKILVSIFVGPAHFIHAPYKAWGAEVAKVTDGRVVVDFLPASAAPPPKQIEGALAGNFDGAFMFNGFNGKRAPFTQMLLLPFLMEGKAEAGSVATWRTNEKFFSHLGQFEKVGITPLSYFQFPGGHFFSGGDPILSLADLKSRKMWALAGTPTRVLKLAGVDHVAGPAARLAEFVQNNTVEGVAGISQDAIITFGGLDFTKSATVRDDARLGVPNFIMFVTTKKWEEISAADQKAIQGISGEVFARAVGKAADVAEAKRRQQLIDKGVKIVETPEAFKQELIEASKPLFEDWKKSAEKMGVDPQAPIDFYKAETAKVAAGS
ncbi:MAG: TRAP transporter substrate-binding protein DctP [Alphaproteobacteria bacterium]|nr:TRAP transporter substrate-binding protein DctP [Alphaproteobacteria bacterium]